MSTVSSLLNPLQSISTETSLANVPMGSVWFPEGPGVFGKQEAPFVWNQRLGGTRGGEESGAEMGDETRRAFWYPIGLGHKCFFF